MQLLENIDNKIYNWDGYPFDFDFELCKGGIRLGYRLQDIDLNGTPELIIGQYDKSYSGYADCVLALFTLDSEQRIIQMFSSIVRGMYFFNSLGDFSCVGSGGAEITIGELYELRNGELFRVESGGSDLRDSFHSDRMFFHVKYPQGFKMSVINGGKLRKPHP